MILPQTQTSNKSACHDSISIANVPGMLVPALVDVAGGGVVCVEHGDDTIGVAVRAGDVGTGGVEVKVSNDLDKDMARTYPVARMQ